MTPVAGKHNGERSISPLWPTESYLFSKKDKSHTIQSSKVVHFIFIAIPLVVAMGGFVYGNRQMASCEDTVGRLDPPELHDRHLHGFERAVQQRECRQSRRRAGIAMDFIYSATYASFFNAMMWVVSSELLPFSMRSKGLAFAVFLQSVVGVVLSQITPVALANISWRYYAVFIATNLTAAAVHLPFLHETSGKSLEEIVGDTLATEQIGAIDVDAKNMVHEEEFGQDVQVEKTLGKSV